MRPRLRVGIDVDGVIADFTYGFTRLAAELNLVNEPWHCEDQEVWNFPEKDQNPAHRFNDGPVWVEMKQRYNWWMTLPPLQDVLGPTTIPSLNQFIRENDVYFITSRPRTLGFSAEKQTELWLQSIGIDAHHASVVATQAGSKGALCDALDITVMLDDHVINLQDLDEHNVVAVCRTWKYNHYNHQWAGYRAPTLYGFLVNLENGRYIKW